MVDLSRPRNIAKMRLVVVFVLLLQTGPIHTVCDNCLPNQCHSDDCYHCNDGYYMYGRSCHQCHQSCATCWSRRDDQCHSCRSGYLFKHNRCDACPDNCAQCSRTDRCYTCNTGYYLHHHVCRTCSGNCATCITSASTCSTCKAGYYGDGCSAHCSDGCNNRICYNTSGNCRNGCRTGYYGTKCDRCPNTCLTCTSLTSCTSCSPGYFGSKCDQPCRNCKNNRCSIDGRCTDGCIDRHYQGNAACDPCSANCNTCQSSSLCDECRTGYHGTICQRECPLNCTSCTNDHNCVRCKRGNYGHSCENQCSTICRSGCNKETGKCSQCIDGYFKEVDQCKECSNGCAKCGNVDSCEACRGGYFLIQSPNHCVLCGQSCSVCNTKDSCTNCKEGHANVNGRCLSCQNCKDYTVCSSQNVCAECLDGYLGQFCGDKCNDTCIQCGKSTGECTGCIGDTFGLYCELKCSRNCVQLSDTNSTCWQHNGTCAAGCMQGFIGPDCSGNANSGEQQIGFDVLVHAVIPAICLLIVVLLVIVGGCAATKRGKRRTDGDHGPQEAIYITAQSDATPSKTYAHVYLDEDITDTPTQVSLYITAQSDSTTNNAYAEVHLDGNLTDTLTGPSLAGITATRLRTRDVSTPSSDREPSRLYTSIDEVNTDTGAPCGRDQIPRSPYPGVGSSSEGSSRLPRTLYPKYPDTLQGRGTVSPMVTSDNQYESLRKNGESTNVYSPLNRTVVFPDSSEPPESHTKRRGGLSSDVDPVYWLPAGEYETLRTRHKTSDTYTSLQADGTARIPAIQRN